MLRRLAERTPPQRDRWVDLVRAVAIVLVVIGHWLAVVVTYDGGLGGEHVLTALPWTRWLSWAFQVMPVFFLAGGFANAASLKPGVPRRDWLLGRADRLLRPTTLFIAVIAASAAVARALGAEPDLIGTAVWLATIPLWFLAAYLPMIVLTPVMHALHRRWGLAVPAVLLVLVAAGDAAVFADVPHGGTANYLLMWLAVHQLGFAWHDGRLPARTGPPLIAAGLAGLVLLTTAGPYPVSMVAEPGAQMQNTAPPSLALLSLAIAQTGLVVLLHDRGNRWLQRPRPWTAVVAVSTVILTLFLWHMTAVVIAAAALYPTGVFPQPPIGTSEWYALRAPWVACLLAVLGVLLALFARAERPARPSWRKAPTALTVIGVACVQAALIGIALAGPDFHAPAALPAWVLATYLTGAAALHLQRARPVRGRAR
ncbi:acyltransferase [Actinomadura sp. WMMB 499]|uniref:acyltransferase family protein n=1 Tax=Actinomadura sp. WMMB 499 TaxID=1219491 RepID=UPI0012467375|nr:acyltransferase [Actinomadura sp. WMMB 499]QFG24620.1 acyltransferase [Actinomadura sp. WMMB 499]